MKKGKQTVIVGAGLSGLTAGLYLLRNGHKVLILEKSSAWGGLVSSFKREGFHFDTGPRSIGNAGILIPMLEDLQIDLPLVKSSFSVGMGKEIIHYDSHEKIDDYISALETLFPEALKEIAVLKTRIRFNTAGARTLNKVPNPYFRHLPHDSNYLFRQLLPWLPSFLFFALKNSLCHSSIEDIMGRISSNQSLNDMVSQHFFKGTPAHFALGYFENYLDYLYPLGGTGRLSDVLAERFLAMGGEIRLEREVMDVEPGGKRIRDRGGEEYGYDSLLWSADLKTLYRSIDLDHLSVKKSRRIRKKRAVYESHRAGESVFTLFLAVDENPRIFGGISGGHFIHTPSTRGLGELHRSRLKKIIKNYKTMEKDEVLSWLKDFCKYNSYEISIPVLRDPSLAPAGQTGLVISLLMDGELFSLVHKSGWYDEFKDRMVELMLQILEESLYPGLRDKIIFSDTATPLTLMKRFNTDGGAISGWSLEKKPPVPDSLPAIGASVKTEIPGIFKAGQWSYSPSGVPIALLTGRIAAGAINKDIGRL